ncbi:MAG: J domain-containing protein [Candidatus Nomurabacteria bacterium]
MKTYYEVLGVPRNATPEEIRKAVKKRSFETYPARGVGGGVGNEDEFKKVQAAKYYLLNDERREAYDKTLPPEEIITPSPPVPAKLKPEPPTPPPETVYEVGPVVKKETIVDTKVSPKAKPVVSKTGDDSAFWKTLFTTCSLLSLLVVTLAIILNSMGVSNKKVETVVKGSRDDQSMVDFYGELDLRTKLGCKYKYPGVVGDPGEDPNVGCIRTPKYQKVLRP